MLRNVLPYSLYRVLFGDRRRFGTTIDAEDRDYQEWMRECERFYLDNQKGTIGSIVNDWGFRIAGQVDLSGKSVLEIGPGILEHCRYWSGIPKNYILVDIREEFLGQSDKIIRSKGVDNVTTILTDGITIDASDGVADVIFTFHQLEHVEKLGSFLDEAARLLAPGGVLVGAVPCEGGLAWGVGRSLTSRRYVKKYMEFDYDKIICWEHPQFVDAVKAALDERFLPVRSVKRPFGFLPFDTNLSWSFIYKNKRS